MNSLDGWEEDNLALALEALGQSTPDARKFFEDSYTLGTARACHFTGYFEMELAGSLTPHPDYPVPLYAMPDLTPLPDRAAINSGALDGIAQIIAWATDPLAAFLLQVQGSGQLTLPDGGTIGIGFAGKNGHRYRSIGQELLKLGVPGPMTLAKIKRYCTEHPDKVQSLLNTNPSYVFFELRDSNTGPIGAMGIPVTPFRSLAVDPEHIPLGTPVWVEVALDDKPTKSLMIAQDIGSAIKGPNRADIFCGTGATAERISGSLNTTGKMIPLVPKG